MAPPLCSSLLFRCVLEKRPHDHVSSKPLYNSETDDSSTDDASNFNSITHDKSPNLLLLIGNDCVNEIGALSNKPAPGFGRLQLLVTAKDPRSVLDGGGVDSIGSRFTSPHLEAVDDLAQRHAGIDCNVIAATNLADGKTTNGIQILGDAVQPRHTLDLFTPIGLHTIPTQLRIDEELPGRFDDLGIVLGGRIEEKLRHKYTSQVDLF